ncbi:glycogen synthase GlgA [candidate division KSB1 bacterium]|nr:glycogen synthase GlgA [candidate division KSB1 bacterium]
MMKNRLKILFVSSEVAPFAKTGGLADVSSALPKALFEAGHDVRVMMPKYGCISERKYVLRDVIRLRKIPVVIRGKEYAVSAKSAFIPETKVQVYFLEYKPFFDKKDLYVDSKTGKDFANNAERFALFCRAALETTRLLHWEPDVIHCNDWPTALIPWLLKNDYAEDVFFEKTRSVLSLHNVAFQGAFEPSVLPKIGLPAELAREGGNMEFYGRVNFLKLGSLYADFLTTVSPTYAHEIQSSEVMGAGLDSVFRARKKELIGILNGVDYTIWNPEVDPLIPSKYGAANLKDKLENKKALTERCALPFSPDVPLIGMITRLAEQKGFDILLEAAEKIFELNLQLVILGTGDSLYEKRLVELQKKFPQKLSLHITFDDDLAHLIEAGCDCFLMPSRFEPCGLNQLYSLRYGTLPIVHATGGLADTIVDLNRDPAKGTGFVFSEYSASALFDAIQRAVESYIDTKNWQKTAKRAMKLDFSWKTSAEKYVKLYSKLDSIKRKN